ncbi:Peptidase-S9 domain-containing protein [Mycena indigotica]|uniref:Peptidase-S9 domain-containing protein n=1 Tax=Mycena indigotica TaxID=2126181 RepID=A0A8H6SIB0_9AGAR|nr:Peptidase-S9 domain-containing protein [Mycena indigotica]KAF7299468.1 Peptidase-S9 domain-containing protein [Mycena indigotica]
MTSRTSTKIHVPHPLSPACPITGILEQLDDGDAAQGRPIALILHGAMGHKDYLFQRRLAQRLPLDSFRFDFRGNHETPGDWHYGSFQSDVDDLFAVGRFLESKGYIITAVVGHSRGSIVGQRWICTAPEARNVTTFVNASARYRMAKLLENVNVIKHWQPGFEKDGYYDWTATVARKPFTTRIRPRDLEEFVKWDTSYIWDQFPARIHVLTIHGLSDETVPPFDALIYARALGARSPGTHTLHMLENADHNFTGRQDEIVGYILEWWDLQARGDITTSGLWMTGLKNKL